MKGQIHFSSVRYPFWPVKFIRYTTLKKVAHEPKLALYISKKHCCFQYDWMWPVKVTGKTKGWPVNSPISPDIVHWLAVILSWDFTRLKGCPPLWDGGLLICIKTNRDVVGVNCRFGITWGIPYGKLTPLPIEVLFKVVHEDYSKQTRHGHIFGLTNVFSTMKIAIVVYDSKFFWVGVHLWKIQTYQCHWTVKRVYIFYFSKIQLVVYYQCCVLIGWATTRLYVIAHQ